MSVTQMRPTFSLETKMSAEEVIHCARLFVEERQAEYQGLFTVTHAMISIKESKRHFWSPYLHLELREEDSQKHVFGRFSPHPSIWTGFMFAYLVIVVLIFFSSIWGVAQLLLGNSPWAFYLIILEVLLAVVLWFGSKTGQKLAYDEMVLMKQTIESCIREKAG